jgi:arylsulfatase A-like enzyme
MSCVPFRQAVEPALRAGQALRVLAAVAARRFAIPRIIVAVGSMALSAVASSAAGQPNILLLLADDLGYSDLGCYGGEIRTPNLDRLAAEGVRFTQFYNCGADVLSRAALHSGLHPRQWQGGPEKGPLRSNMVTLAELLRRAGYATVLSGTWHLRSSQRDTPTDRGFDEFYGGLDGISDHFNPARPEPKFHLGKPRPFVHHGKPVTEFPENFYSSDAFADFAVAAVHRLAKSNRPFFLNLSFAAPHFPLQAPAPDVERYRGQYRPGYEATREVRARRQIELGLFKPGTAPPAPASLDYLYEHEWVAWTALDQPGREREEARMEVYAAMVDRMDQGIGRVLAALEQSGAAGNTVVVFLSDNGGSGHFPVRTAEMRPRIAQDAFNVFNRGLPVGDPRSYEFVGTGWGWAQNAPFRRFKNWTYEGGICTPMIVRWPGVARPGRISGEPGHVVDLMPTLLEIARATYPESHAGKSVSPLEGRSLTPILRGKTPPARRVALGWELMGSRAYRDGNWKLVMAAGIGAWELYDLAADRSEAVDVAAKHPERVVQMAANWEAWARQTGAPIR